MSDTHTHTHTHSVSETRCHSFLTSCRIGKESFLSLHLLTGGSSKPYLYAFYIYTNKVHRWGTGQISEEDDLCLTCMQCCSKILSYNPFIVPYCLSQLRTNAQLCLCCPLSLWSVSMEQLCTGESYQRYKYFRACMWVEREHVTPDQLCCSNALTEFRLGGEYLTAD